MADLFTDMVALVTGGSAGIGKATALAFAREGAAVVIADINEDDAQGTVREIEAHGGRGLAIKADVSQVADVTAMVTDTIEQFGRIDCAFNNAGIVGIVSHIADYPEAAWDRVMNVQLKGTFLCMKYEIRQMLTQGGGAIVNAGSVMGVVGSALGSPAYCASKHGIVGLTKVAALDCAQSGIRVNAVCPGFVRTAMVDRLVGSDSHADAALTARHPVGRMGTPEEVAETVLWLCSDKASFVTGTAMMMDGGYTAQ